MKDGLDMLAPASPKAVAAREYPTEDHRHAAHIRGQREAWGAGSQPPSQSGQLAERRFSSAWRTSGRCSTSCDGRLTGSSCGSCTKIVGVAGVEELVAIPIGGTQQWISVRGHDRDNPILLMIHGGPASPEIPTSWFFQSGWEDYFTVVQWDQRGSGKSYNANDPKTIQPTLSLERITLDAEEVVQYLRAKYHKDKIFVLGHSWGSVVGIQLAHRHPEWLHAYVGMGQVISGQENERVGYQMTLQVAESTHNTEAVNDLKSIAPYPNADGTMPLEKINKERKWSVNFGGLAWGRESLAYYSNLMQLSPDYTGADIAAVNKGAALSLGPLLGDMLHFDYRATTEWHCPIVIFAGRHDSIGGRLPFLLKVLSAEKAL